MHRWLCIPVALAVSTPYTLEDLQESLAMIQMNDQWTQQLVTLDIMHKGNGNNYGVWEKIKEWTQHFDDDEVNDPDSYKDQMQYVPKHGTPPRRLPSPTWPETPPECHGPYAPAQLPNEDTPCASELEGKTCQYNHFKCWETDCAGIEMMPLYYVMCTGGSWLIFPLVPQAISDCEEKKATCGPLEEEKGDRWWIGPKWDPRNIPFYKDNDWGYDRHGQNLDKADGLAAGSPWSHDGSDWVRTPPSSLAEVDELEDKPARQEPARTEALVEQEETTETAPIASIDRAAEALLVAEQPEEAAVSASLAEPQALVEDAQPLAADAEKEVSGPRRQNGEKVTETRRAESLAESHSTEALGSILAEAYAEAEAEAETQTSGPSSLVETRSLPSRVLAMFGNGL